MLVSVGDGRRGRRVVRRSVASGAPGLSARAAATGDQGDDGEERRNTHGSGQRNRSATAPKERWLNVPRAIVTRNKNRLAAILLGGAAAWLVRAGTKNGGPSDFLSACR